jgi:hypothetical protein
MQNHSDPLPNYYYAVRSRTHRCTEDHPEDQFCSTCAGEGWSKAMEWDIVMLLVCHTRRFNGMYSFSGGKRHWLSYITWEEFDMLTAFGVEWKDAEDVFTQLVLS